LKTQRDAVAVGRHEASVSLFRRRAAAHVTP
jgi:hypothetical protein